MKYFNKNNQNYLPQYFYRFPTFSVNKGTQGVDIVLIFRYILYKRDGI